MTYLLEIAMGVAMVLAVGGLTYASPADEQNDDILLVAKKRKDKDKDKGKSSKNKVVHKKNGHDLLPKNKLKNMDDGKTNTLKTFKDKKGGKHKVHAKVSNGKVNSMHVKTPKGKTVTMKKSNKDPRKNKRKVALGDSMDAAVTHAALDDGADANLTRVADGDTIFFFYFGPGIQIIITFPSDSVADPNDMTEGADS